MPDKNDTTTTTATHTPGPWRRGDNRFDVVADEYRVVATVAHDRQGLNRGLETSEANAHLIAAAPDLLDALRRSIEVLDAEGIVYGNCDDEPLDVLSAARAAIAKAEGR